MLNTKQVMIWLLSFLIAIKASANLPHLTEGPPLFLGEGEQRLIYIPEIKRFSISQSKICRAISLPNDLDQERSNSYLLIKGVAQGFTDLWVWKTNGQVEKRAIHVETWQRETLSHSLQKTLGQLNEVEIIPFEKGAVLRGEIYSFEEASKVHAIKNSFQKEIIDETLISDSLLTSAENKITSWIKNSTYSSQIKIEKKGQVLWIIGDLKNDAERVFVQKQIQALFPLAQIQLSSLPDETPTIFFKVFLLEIKIDHLQSLGFQWPSAIESAFHVTTSKIQDILELDVGIQALERNGSAKILSKPELAVRAPGEAELFAGGELPIRHQGRFYSNVTWKSFGLTLKLKPTHSTQTKVRLDIMTEVSHLDSSIAVDQIPGLRSNRMKTQIDAQFGSPLLLSGLLQEDIRKQARGLPILKDIPILGRLFGSKDFLNEQSELVAILLPLLQVPTPSLNAVGEILPKGKLPPARNWISKQELIQLKSHPHYPWNAFQ